jgi:hypothetical protein
MPKTREQKLELIKNTLSGIETRANESMSTGQDGFGQDFVPSDLASTIIDNVRNQSTFVSKIGAPIAMPSATYTIPVEGADPTWVATGENANVTGDAVTTSKAGTDDVVLSAKKYSASVYASGELDDDSIINIRTYLGDKMSRSYAELLDKVWFNGDTVTAATGNVNSDDAAPAAGSYFLHQDGLVKAGLANNAVNAGALDLADIRGMRKALGLKGINPADLLLVPSTDVYFGLLGLTQAETVEKFGGRATVVNGTIAAIDGIEVLPSSLLLNAEADGKVSATPANNTTGRMLLVYKPDMLHGFKRGLQVFTEYLPEYDQFRFTSHVRYAIKAKGTDSVALAHNITL